MLKGSFLMEILTTVNHFQGENLLILNIHSIYTHLLKTYYEPDAGMMEKIAWENSLSRWNSLDEHQMNK